MLYQQNRFTRFCIISELSGLNSGKMRIIFRNVSSYKISTATIELYVAVLQSIENGLCHRPFFCILKRSASADRSFIFRYNYLLITTLRPSALSTVKCLSVAVCVTVIVSPFLSAITVSSSLASLS